ncbi:MAG: hypothetical protein D6681_02835, partial [Calditrichaeota bacterium]
MQAVRPYLRWLLVIFWFIPVLVLADKGGPSPAGLAWADSQHVDFKWIPLSGTVLNSTSTNHDTVYAVTLPFTFYFYDQPFTTLYVSTNGYITFHNYGVSSFPGNDNLVRTGQPDSLIAAFWDNLKFVATSQIYSDVRGTAPFRQAVIGYQDMKVNGGGTVTFEIILYESTNIIKFQYLLGALPSPDERGKSATIGIRFSNLTVSDSLLYSFNQQVLSDSFAILFYPSAALTATTTLNPTAVSAGQVAQKFRLKVNSITAAVTSLSRMANADVVRIKNPFNNVISIVDTIQVDGISYFFINRTTPPTPDEYTVFPTIATWSYDAVTDSLFLRFPPLAVRDSVQVSFRVDIPNNLGGQNFNIHTFTRVDVANAALNSAAFTVSTGAVDHYSITPANDTTVTANTTIAFTVTALDEFGNPVANNDSLLLSATSANVIFLPSSKKAFFRGGTTASFTVRDTVAENFTVVAVNADDNTLRINSGVVTVTPEVANRFTILSSTGPITVGTDRTLRVKLTDVYGNAISGSNVTFQRVSGGNGNFSGSVSATVATDAGGIAEATYTASTLISFVGDTLQVSSGAVVDTIILPLVAGAVASYEFSPGTAQTTTAGVGVTFTLTARDV